MVNKMWQNPLQLSSTAMAFSNGSMDKAIILGMDAGCRMQDAGFLL